MKKVIAGLFTAVATVALCVFMAACSSSFTGTYKFVSMSMEMNGVNINYEVGKEYMGVTFSEDMVVMKINEDNTFSMSSSVSGEAVEEKGTWEEKEGKYYFTSDGETVEVKKDGNKIIFEQEGVKIVLKK